MRPEPLVQEMVEEPWGDGPGLLTSLWRYRVLVVVMALAGGVAGYGLSLLQPVTYQASTQVFLSDPRTATVFGDQRPSLESGEYAAQQVLLFRSRPVRQRAAETLGAGRSPEDLEEQVEVELAGEGSLLIEVAGTGASPEVAREVTDAVVQAFREVVSQQSLDRATEAAAQLDPQRQDYELRIAELQQQLGADPDSPVIQSQIAALSEQLLGLESRAQELRANAGAFGDGVNLAEPAIAGEDPVSPTPLRNGALAALLGGAVAGVIAYWRAGRARVFATPDDPAMILGAPLLGEIPRYRGTRSSTLAGQMSLDTPTTEAYQFVLASIEYALEGVSGTALLVTSAGPGDGKTTTALQLAAAASRDGRRVVLVDADIRAMGLTRMLGAAGRNGLTELALQHLEVDQSVHYLPVRDEVLLPVVTAGKRVGDPGSFFRTPQVRKALQRVKDEAELVILDSSPVLSVADTSVIAAMVDGVVLVVDHKTPLTQLNLLRQRFSFVSTPLLGYVYNRSDSPLLAAYGYGYRDDAVDAGNDRGSPGVKGWRRRLRRSAARSGAAGDDETTAKE